jgi:anti-sigma factor RsiW
MKTCKDLADTLYELVEGEVALEVRRALELHLAHCPPCAVLVETYRLTIHLSRKLPPAPMPPGCLARLQAALEGGRRPPAAGPTPD